jgi:deoxyribodipyrimidine photo-lyase
MSSSVALWWIRRDLRLSDNQALAAALAQAGQVVPVFVLDPALWRSPQASEKRLAFLLGGLRQLDADLRARGSRLIVRQGQPRRELAALMAETGADQIFAEQDHSRYARHRDAEVARHLALRLISSLTVHPPAAVLKAGGTPFSRAWKALMLPLPNSVLPAPECIRTPANIRSEAIPGEPMLSSAVTSVPGEAEAQRRLSLFVDQDDPAIYRYAEGRNRLDMDGTSQLSPYFVLGCSRLDRLPSPRIAPSSLRQTRPPRPAPRRG